MNHLYSPLKQISNNCWIPDFESRYFTADFPYGLAIIEELAKIVDLETPNISETMNWFKKLLIMIIISISVIMELIILQMYMTLI